jgi:Glycosyltransferase
MAKVFLISPIIENLILFRRELILTLAEQRYDITLLCSFEKEFEDFAKVGVRFINVDIDRRGTNIFTELKLFLNYYQILKKERPDVVLTYTTKCSVYGGAVCRMLKIPYIINNSGLFDPKRISRLFGALLDVLHKIGYSRTACMMYQNPSEMAYFKKILPSHVPFRLLPGSGVNLERFKVLPYPQDGDVNFLMICRIQKEKGIEEYLYAAAQLKPKYPKANFWILGGFDEDYHSQVDEMVNKGTITYYEPVKDVRPYIKKAHCIVNPSYHEGMSNVLLEASASGRPAVTSDCTGCNNIILNGVSGVLAKVADKEDVAAKMEAFIKLPYNKKVEMGKNGRKIVEERFNRQIVVKAYVEEIEKICQKNK